MYVNNCAADKRCCLNILKMSAASNVTTDFLSSQASANLDDVIKILDAALKSVILAETAGGIALEVWKYSEISDAFNRIVRGTATLANKDMTQNAMQSDESSVVKAVHTTARALRELNEKGAGNRLQEIIVRAEHQKIEI